jgi:hypothetical protein
MSSLPNPDPVNTPWHRLFLFWETYNKEFINLLKKWHDDTAQLRTPGPGIGPGPLVSSGNELYDSFLDTWGEGNFEDPNVSLDDKSYFAAVGVASIEPRAQCLQVLKNILETNPNGDLKQPLKLKVSPQVANNMAQAALDQLGTRFSNIYDTLKDKVDPNVSAAIGGSSDTYLKCLQRMMDIETECFKVQRDFLKTGMVS